MENQAPDSFNRKDELDKMLAAAIAEHGENGEVANFIRGQIADLEITTPTPSSSDNAKAEKSPASIPDSIEDRAKQGMVLYVVIGMVLIFVLLGFSSLFFGLLAAKWDMI